MVQVPRRSVLLAFQIAVDELDEDTRHGLRSTDIQAVEAFWYLSEPDATSAGFVLLLLDGRRAHLQSIENYLTDGSPDGINVVMLGEDEGVPAAVNPGDPPGGWSREVDDLNAWLRKAKAS